MLKSFKNWWNVPVTLSQGWLNLGLLLFWISGIVYGIEYGIELRDGIGYWFQDKIDSFNEFKKQFK